MRVWEENDCWIEETYVIAMHTPEGKKYTFSMLRKFIEIVKDKTEAMCVIPEGKIFRLFDKHFDIEKIHLTEHGYLCMARHKGV